MSNLSAYSYPDIVHPGLFVNHGAPFSTNPNVYPIVLQILAQLRTAQSEWNAWKVVGTSFQNSLQKEQQLRLKDKLNFHVQEQQLLNQTTSLRSQLEKVTEDNRALQRDMQMLEQNLSICKAANLQAHNGVQKGDILNLTKVIQIKDELLLQTQEEAKRNNEKLQEALQRIKDKDAQLEDIKEERSTLKEGLELAKKEIENLRVQEQENHSKFQKSIEQKFNAIETSLVTIAQLLNEELTIQKEKFHKSLTDLRSNANENHVINEGLKVLIEDCGKLKAQERECQSKIQKALTENLNIMARSLTTQAQLNEELAKQKDELKKSLEDLKNKSEGEKHEINEELKKFKEEVIKHKAEERENQSKLQNILEQKLNVVDTLTRQVRVNEGLRKEKEELQKSLDDVKSKSEAEKRVLSEELRKYKETTFSVIGPCGPSQLTEMEMPQPGVGMYKAALQKYMLPGCIIQAIGSFRSTGDMPSINFDFPDGIALHIVFRFQLGHIYRNTYISGKWGPEEKGGSMPVRQGQEFKVTITSTDENFQICINGVKFANYKHRIEKHLIRGIFIDGPIDLQKVQYFTPTNV